MPGWIDGPVKQVEIGLSDEFLIGRQSGPGSGARAAGAVGSIRLDEVRREKLLDPLRANPRFQLLMMDLAFPDDPFGSS